MSMENLTKNKVIHVYVIWGGRKGTPPFILNLRARYPLNRWLCGPPPPKKRPGRFEGEKNLLTLLGIEVRAFRHVPQSVHRLRYSDSRAHYLTVHLEFGKWKADSVRSL